MWYQHNEQYIALHVYVQPGAKKTAIAGLHGAALKIRLHAPPLEGRANDALIKFIACFFGVPARQVVLKKGHKSRSKTLIVTGSLRDPEELLSFV